MKTDRQFCVACGQHQPVKAEPHAGAQWVRCQVCEAVLQMDRPRSTNPIAASPQAVGRWAEKTQQVIKETK